MQPLLLLDCGEVLSPDMDHAAAEFMLKAMERMGYDALNLAGPELSFGKEFLERSRSLVSFPYIASNLLYEGGRLPWIREYVIKEVGGIRVAILGILDPEDFKKISKGDDLKGFSVIPPKSALEKLIPEVRVKSDMVILLSQFGEMREKSTLELVGAVQGVDIAVFSEKNFLETPTSKNTVFLHTGTEGVMIGLATMTFDDKGVRTVGERKNFQLNKSVPDSKEMLELIEAYKKGRPQ